MVNVATRASNGCSSGDGKIVPAPAWLDNNNAHCETQELGTREQRRRDERAEVREQRAPRVLPDPCSLRSAHTNVREVAHERW